jgi:uncharacterized protein YdaU (DUF1376 family)
MTKASPSFQFYPTDLAPHVDPLNMEERGVYLTLMRYLWSSGPMPIDEAEALIGKPWLSCGLILRRKFIESDGTICLEWMEEQREKQATFRRLQAEKGKKGGRPKSSESTSTKAEKPSLNRSLTESKPNESPRIGVGVGNGVGIGEGNSGRGSRGKDHVHEAILWPSFDDFWSLYEKKGSRKLSEAEWRKIGQRDREAIMHRVPDYNRAKPDKLYRKDGQRFLRDRTWEDEIITSNHRTNGSESIADKTAGVLEILRAGRL